MAVPAVPSSLLEPVWAEFTALLPERGEFHPDHPLGCHRRRIPDRVVFEHIVEALVHAGACRGAGRLPPIIGLLLADIGADGCITKAPCGGDKTGPSPVD
jgi:hypothetical protein